LSFLLIIPTSLRSTLFPYTTLFRSPGVSLNAFEARTDHAHYFMLAGANQVLQRPSHLPLVIGDQHAHISRCRNFHANRADKLNGARGSRDIEGKAARVAARELGNDRVSKRK